ncbi:MAG: hypothetical protein ACYC3K_13350 [Candidatus Nanopelagicales bacterium]
MILVVAWSVALMALALIVSQAALRQIQPSGRSADASAALAAAEAGIDDYRARLQAVPTYYLNDDPTNAALHGWAPVPGGNTQSEFRYAVDASRAGVGGEVRVISMGRSGGATRTVEGIMSKRSTLDYVYMSDVETPSADLPGAYSTAANSGGSTGVTAQQLARLLCARRFYETGQVSPTGISPLTGKMRNLNFCQWAGIYSSERLRGALHTNDVWRLEATSLVNTIDPNAITSSCRSAAEGLQPGEAGCSSTHRYIETSYGYSNNSNGATWNTTNTRYQGDAANPANGTDRTNRNPRYDSVLDLPPSPATLKKHASDSGCVFTGPTRIRFAEESGVGVMYVTSPDTKVTAPACDGADGTSFGTGTATNQVTRRIVLTNLAGVVIYVQNVRRSTEADDPDNAFDLNNRWAAGSEPSCAIKTSTRVYPFVIPNDATDQGYFASGSTYKGFPSELANPASPWYGSSCSNGDLYVQGQFRGQVTLATESNVVLTSSLIDSQQVVGTTTGQPLASSQSTIGVVSNKFTYIYRPFNASNNWVADWRTSNAQDVKFNFAVMAIDQCFAAQDPYFGARNGNLYMWGSLAQKYRCVVGSNGGYNKQYSYDARLARRTPPYMLELSNEPWQDDRVGEVTPLEQPVGTTAWPLLYADDVSATVGNVAVSAGPATVAVVGTQANVTATGPGLIIVTYTVTSGGLAEYRRLVILAE